MFLTICFNFLAEYLYNQAPNEDGSVGTVQCDRNGTTPYTITRECLFVDYNSIDNITDEGHNYFLSRNLINTESKAVFGEVYWNFTNDVKLTTGLRYTVDTKTSTPTPSQLLMAVDYDEDGNIESPGISSGGKVGKGHYALPDVTQEWKAFTGRVVLDWKGETPFTDETLFYVSYAHGYKGGGTNPPRMDIDPTVVQYQPLASTFKPEYVNSIEFGTKNSLLDESMQINTTAFYYDYSDYQISQIVDRISLNENFDAETWGLEFEGFWQFTDQTRFDMNLGYLKTRLGSGAKSIDVMNRTQGNDDWVVIRPWIQVPSNCVAPVEIVEMLVADGGDHRIDLSMLCGGADRWGTWAPLGDDQHEIRNFGSVGILNLMMF